MSDLLSQAEIDALLKAGLGGTEDAGEEQPAASAAPTQPDDGGGDSMAIDQSEIDALLSAAAGGAVEQPAQPFQSTMAHTKKSRPGAKKRRTVVSAEGQVNVQPAVFEPFDSEEESDETTNLEVILNLDLEIRVELGKTHTTVRDVLEMGQGSVLELNKLNGEPVDLKVNHRPFSKGEMIVIGENFGVRVTDILSVPEIIEALR
jgi:flagellar motor switch protein FliN/FliY